MLKSKNERVLRMNISLKEANEIREKLMMEHATITARVDAARQEYAKACSVAREEFGVEKVDELVAIKQSLEKENEEKLAVFLEQIDAVKSEMAKATLLLAGIK